MNRIEEEINGINSNPANCQTYVRMNNSLAIIDEMEAQCQW